MAAATADLSTEAHTLRLGAQIADAARRGDVIALLGPLGSGKTTLARGFIHHLAGDGEEVVSPTFTLVQTYDSPAGTIWHFDLYRLVKAEDVWELGLEEALVAGISLIEWPERLGPLLSSVRLDVALSLAGAGRNVTLRGWPDRVASILSHVRA